MTARDVLTFVDQTRPNAYTDLEKIGFLNIIEGRVYSEIYSHDDGFDAEFELIQEGEEDRELSVPSPYTNLYIYFVMAMIDFYNGDVNRYNDTIVMYNQAWDDFASYHLRNNKPKQTNLTGMFPERGWV